MDIIFCYALPLESRFLLLNSQVLQSEYTLERIYTTEE